MIYDSEIKIDRLKSRKGMTIVGLFMTYPAVRLFPFAIRKVCKSIGFSFSSEGLRIE